MSGSPQNNHTDSPVWYTQPHPDEYSYNPGYGFFQKPPSAAETDALRRYAMGIAAALMGYLALGALLPLIVASLLGQPAGSAALPRNPSHQALYYMISGLVMAVSLSVPFVFYGLAIRIPRPVALPTARRPQLSFMLPAALVGLGLSVIGRFFMLTTAALLGSIGLTVAVVEPQMPDSLLGFVLYALNLTVVPALFEELVVRGVVMQSLRRFGDGFALITSSLLFMLLHQSLLQYPNALLMGLFIGYAVLYTGSIWTGVILHLVNNVSVLILMVVERTLGLPTPVALLYYGAMLLAALVALAFLVKRSPALFCIPASRALNPFPALCRIFYSAPMVLPALLALLLTALQGMRVAL
jgi:membrane protease YdiL (CAAX protease family)